MERAEDEVVVGEATQPGGPRPTIGGLIEEAERRTGSLPTSPPGLLHPLLATRLQQPLLEAMSRGRGLLEAPLPAPRSAGRSLGWSLLEIAPLRHRRSPLSGL